MTTNPASTEETFRRVVAEIVLSLDGRVNGAGGEYDMGWIVPHETYGKPAIAAALRLFFGQ
jgi:hypothetical protein